MKKRYVIEFTVEAEDFSDEWIKGQALQELNCMSPFPEDIAFYRKDNPWHTGTPTEEGWYLCKYVCIHECKNKGRVDYDIRRIYIEDGFRYITGRASDDVWKLIEWQKIED